MPRNVHEIRTFLGLCSYYRRYVKDFATHAAPLHELTKKDVAYIWDNRKQVAFDFLKSALTSAPILATSRDEGTCVLDVDASDMAMGAVLQQEQEGVLCVIGYTSRIFNTCEKKYCITRKELAAIIFGLKQYRQYLLGRQFIVRSDHAALTFLHSAKELIGQQARWLDFMKEFNFTLQHRAGTTHGNADALFQNIPVATSRLLVRPVSAGGRAVGELGQSLRMCPTPLQPKHATGGRGVPEARSPLDPNGRNAGRDPPGPAAGVRVW